MKVRDVLTYNEERMEEVMDKYDKCEICSRIAEKTVFNPRNDMYRLLCSAHATEVESNMRAAGWNIKVEDINYGGSYD